MYAPVEKSKKNKSQAAVNPVSQKKANGKQGFGFVGNRSEAKQGAHLQAARGNYSAQQQQPVERQENKPGLEVAQFFINHDAPDITADNGRAGKVSVENIYGDPYGPAYNSPSVEPFGWGQLETAGHTLGNTQPNNSHYNAVRMHLWNGRLNGPGDNEFNLAPGPAIVNSSMSAGPETAAKNAVENGYRIWLCTKVTYQNNGPNPNDFTNVIPNHMEMEWGFMNDTDGNRVKAFFHPKPTAGRGSAEPPAWSTAIDQPAGAMTSMRKNQYTALNPTDTAKLDTLFTGVSLQEKAQAYDLVPDPLKKHILLNHSEVFFTFTDGIKGAILDALPVAEISTMLTNTIGLADADQLLEHVFYPLCALNKDAKVQQFFNILGDPVKAKSIQRGRWELMQHLGAIAATYMKKSYICFKMAPIANQNGLLNVMSLAERDTLLTDADNGNARSQVLRLWAKSNGHNKSDSMLSFVTGKIGAFFLEEFDAKLKWIRFNEKNPPMQRPKRTLKPYSK